MSDVNSKAWVISVRLNDGQRLYYSPASGRQGGQPDWTPRANQAQVFDTEAEAVGVAARFETNASAQEYDVLPQPR